MAPSDDGVGVSCGCRGKSKKKKSYRRAASPRQSLVVASPKVPAAEPAAEPAAARVPPAAALDTVPEEENVESSSAMEAPPPMVSPSFEDEHDDAEVKPRKSRMSSIYHDATGGLIAYDSDDDFFYDAHEEEDNGEGDATEAERIKSFVTDTTGGDGGSSSFNWDDLELSSEEISNISLPISKEDRQAHRQIRSSLVSYPIVTTSHLPEAPPASMSLEDPDSLMGKDDDGDDGDPLPLRERHSADKAGRQFRVNTVLERRSVTNVPQITQLLELPSVVNAHKDRGFPGALTKDEVKACIELADELSKPEHASFASQVYAYVDFGVERKPYALCRFLRPFQFEVSGAMERLRKGSKDWQAARAAKFYPNMSKDCFGGRTSLAAFLQLYPFVPIGSAKNGCPVTYCQGGKIDPEGLLCIVDLEGARRFFWHNSMCKTPKRFHELQTTTHPNLVRCEGITVLDLEGLSSSQLSGDTKNVLGALSHVGDFFPETMHCMVIINAPGIFALFWRLIQRFLDPRTARRIQIYKGGSKQQARLLELIDKSELPSDYGGNRPSIADHIEMSAAAEEAANSGSAVGVSPANPLPEIRSLDVSKRGCRASAKFSVKAGQFMTLRAFTRSASSIHLSVTSTSSDVALPSPLTLRGDTEVSPPGPNDVQLHSSPVICGPANLTVSVKDMDDAPKKSKYARGHILLVGELSLSSSS